MRYWYKLHRWISLICMIFFLLLCVTGLPLLFKTEIYEYYLLHKPMEHRTLEYQSIWNDAADGFRLVKDKYPDKTIKAVSAMPDKGRLLYRIQDKNSTKVVDARLSMGGEQISYYPDTKSLQNWHGESVRYSFISKFMHIMHRLHMYMGLGKGGMIFLGMMCVMSLFSVISGVIIYAPFTKKIKFGRIDDDNATVKWFGWHKFLGIVTGVWAGVLCFSGVMIVVFSLGYGTYISDTRAEALQNLPKTVQGQNVEFTAAVNYVQQQFPKKYILSVDTPDRLTNHSRYVFYLTQAKKMPADFMGQMVFVGTDEQGRLQYFTRPLPIYLSVAAAALDLHIHNHDNFYLKIIWAILDIATIIVIISGIIGWWKRRRKISKKNNKSRRTDMTKYIVWKMPIALFVLSAMGMVLPLYGSEYDMPGIIAWLAAGLLCLYQWYKQNNL